MPWKATDAMSERMKFLVELKRGELSMAELCRNYGISRQAGYDLKKRFEAKGARAIEDASRAPHSHPNAVADKTRETVISARRKHPTWGPKKLKPWLEKRRPDVVFPAESTIGVIIHDAGLAGRARRRRHSPPQAWALSACDEANDVWGIDFKGWFYTGDRARCDPLSLSDLTTRFVLRLQAVERTDTEHVWAILDAALREFGLPKVIRSDNGTPFASVGVGGLSQLSIRLVKAGVLPERIEPGKPQQNGRHERLHRTVKADTARPPARNLRKQQERFDEFRRIFNEERPHEALGLKTPSSRYCHSPRSYCGRLRSPDYPHDHHVRRVRSNGEIKWKSELLFLGRALIGEPVGIQEADNGQWTVSYGPVILGHIDESKCFSRLTRDSRSQLETSQDR